MLGNFLAESTGTMRPIAPRVSEGWVYDRDTQARVVQLGSAAWWIWLDAATTTSFSYPLFDASVGYIVGFMTVRKERRQRGGAYWVAYRRIAHQLHKCYLGASAAVTIQALGTCAERLQRKEVVPPDQV
jgi:LuxR family maltose regulon positive regulatory protein